MEPASTSAAAYRGLVAMAEKHCVDALSTAGSPEWRCSTSVMASRQPASYASRRLRSHPWCGGVITLHRHCTE